MYRIYGALVAYLLFCIVCSEYTVVSPGYSLYFDGVDDFVSATSSGCSGDGINPFDQEELTMTFWFMVPNGRGNTETSFMAGMKLEQGISMFQASDSNAKYRLRHRTNYEANYNDPNFINEDTKCYWGGVDTTATAGHSPRPQTLGMYDGEWHHIALTYNPDESHIWLDGHLMFDCIYDYPSKRLFTGPTFMLGMVTDDISAGNHDPFEGYIDEVRLYNRSMTESEILNVRYKTLSTVEEKDGLILWYTFDEGEGDLAIDHSGNDLHGRLGGGLNGKSPIFHASTAPIASKKENVIALRSSNDPNYYQDVYFHTVESVYDNGLVADYQFEFSNCNGSENAIYTWGSKSSPINMTTTITTENNYLRIWPSNAIGTNMTCDFKITDLVGSESIKLIFVVEENHMPLIGTGGYAIECNGESDWAFAKDFEWISKVQDYGIGSQPMTVEWWQYMDATAESDSAVFSIGQGEQDAPHIRDLDGGSSIGRFVVRMPYTNGRGGFLFDSFEEDTDVTKFYKGWNHYALTTDMYSGRNTDFYINGELQDHFDHEPTGPSITMRGLTLCTWTFWSEIYHKAKIDEFRIWSTVRTQEEIISTMNTKLRGDEPYLKGYWDFDSESTEVAYDKSGNGNDLIFGGCAPCNKHYTGTKITEDGKESICQPSAKSARSSTYVDGVVHGGFHCYINQTEIKDEWKPKKILSGARVGGFVQDQYFLVGDDIVITLNGSDTDITDNTAFKITQHPTNGYFQVKYSEQTRNASIFSNSLPGSVKLLYYTPYDSLQAGEIHDTFKYSITDGILESAQVEIKIAVACLPGTFIDPTTKRCTPCNKGSYTSYPNYQATCNRCPKNTYQDADGRQSCKECQAGVSFSEEGAHQCSRCNETYTTMSSEEKTSITVDATQCELNFMDKGETIASTLEVNIQSIIDLHNTSNHRVYSNLLSRYGSLHQTHKGTTLDMKDMFFKVNLPLEQWVVDVESASSSFGIHNASSIVGEQEVFIHQSSDLAWAPYRTNGGLADIVLIYKEPVYITGVVIYESYNPGTVYRIESWNEENSSWDRLWQRTSKLVEIERVVVPFKPNICPSYSKTNKIRLTLDTLRVDGRNEIDAVKLLGVKDIINFDKVYIVGNDSKITYNSPSAAEVKSLAYYEYFGIVVRECTDAATEYSYQYSMKVNLDPIYLPLDSTLFYVCTIISVVGLVLTAVSIFGLIKFRTNSILKAQSVPFLVLITVGIAILFTYALIVTLSKRYVEILDDVCAIKPFLFGFGFSIILSCLALKTWRIKQIFVQKKIKQVKITNGDLLRGVVAYTVVVFLINLIWGFVDRLKLVEVINDVNVTYECGSDVEFVFSLIQYILMGGIVAVVVLFAYRIRDVPTIFNEASSLGFVSYNIAFSTLVAGVAAAFSTNTNLKFVFQLMAIFIVSFATLSVIILRLFWQVANGMEKLLDSSKSSKKGSGRVTITKMKTSKKPSMVTEDDMDMARGSIRLSIQEEI